MPVPAPRQTLNRESQAEIAKSGRTAHPQILVPVKNSRAKDTKHSSIRVFDGPESHAAADKLGAFAYAWRGDIYLGKHLGQSGAPSRETALRHELIHAYQTRNTGPYASEVALETEADAHSGFHPTLAADPDTPHGFW